MRKPRPPAQVREPYEKDVVDTALELASLGGGAKAGAYGLSHLSEVLMSLAMRMPEFQTELLRFVEVFPAVDGPRDAARHLAEYFDRSHAPPLVGSLVRAASHLPGGSMLLSGAAEREITRAARQFIVGVNPEEAAKEVGRLWLAGSAATLDLLGENTYSQAEAEAYADRLRTALETLLDASNVWPQNSLLERDDIGDLGRVAVSIKPSALAPDFRPLTAASGLDGVKCRLRPILRIAAQRGAQVWFDMERFEERDLTHRLVRELLDESDLADLRAGVVVQSYLRDSVEDLVQLLAWASGRSTPISVRLVKGANWDIETIVADTAGWQSPVFGDKAETDLNYELCTRILQEAHGRVRAAFATHNIRSLAYAIAAARHAGIPDNGYEIQLLYGMAEPVHEAVRQQGLRLRVYAPMGEWVPGMAFLARRLLENTSNESFIRRRFAEGRGLDVLLTNPKPSRHRPKYLGRAHEGRTVGPAAYQPEPPAEWHQAPVRARMRAEVEKRMGDLVNFVPAAVAGRDVQTSRLIQSVNPASPVTIVGNSACCGPVEVEQAIAAGEEVLEDWASTPWQARADILKRAAAWLRERRFSVAALEVSEAGNTWADADADVCEAIGYLECYARTAGRLGRGGAVQSLPGEESTLSYRGRGVTAVIAPWNFPLATPAGMAAASFVTGNPTLLKPAEQTPCTTRLLYDALVAGGAPPGTLSFLPGYGEEIGEMLLTHPSVVTVAFTGSKAVGVHVIEQAAKTVPGQRDIRRVLPEIGGKDALIVDSDADLDVAVPAAVRSAFGFAGQRCSVASRLVVLEHVHKAFLERFVEATKALAIGDPAFMGTEMGPLIDEDAVKRVRGWQERAPDFGEVVLQWENLPARGYFVGPTVIDRVEPGSEIATEEIFGPVAAVMVASDFEDALRIANHGEYALTAGLISRSPSHIAGARRHLRAGNVYVNREIVGAVAGRRPFGGFGMSGSGAKAGRPDYLLQFVQSRVVTESTIRQGVASAL